MSVDSELVHRTPGDVLRALTEAAHAEQPFTIAGVTYVPEARLQALTEQLRVLCWAGDVYGGGLLPTGVLRAELRL